MHFRNARERGKQATALLLGALLALVAVMPFAGSAVAQEASPAAEEAPSGLAALGLQEVVITANADSFAVRVAPPVVEGWTLVTFINESETPANVNLAGLPEGQNAGDVSSAIFAAFQGEGGELPEWWLDASFFGGAVTPAGGTTQTVVYLTPGKVAVFSSNPMGTQPIQTIQVATPEELENLYGIVPEPEASPVAEASPAAAGPAVPADVVVSINDGEYATETAPVAGPQIWEVTNNSSQVSEFVLVSVDYEIPAEEAVLWAQTYAAGDVGNAVVQNGTGLLSPGATAYVQLDLAPGTYVLFSTAPDTAGGIQSSNGLNLVFTVA